jgi:hypothetical protein
VRDEGERVHDVLATDLFPWNNRFKAGVRYRSEGRHRGKLLFPVMITTDVVEVGGGVIQISSTPPVMRRDVPGRGYVIPRRSESRHASISEVERARRRFRSQS